MKLLSFVLAPLLATLSLATPLLSRAEPTDLPRLVVYFQTTHDSSGQPISMLPLVHEKGIALTHLIVCSLHINAGSVIHLNDYPPSDPRFYTLWNETVVLKQAGVKIMGMVGGAAAGSFNSATLDGSEENFEHYYGQLHDVITDFGLDGMDLDVEQSMSQSGISRLVSRLQSDFGSDFLITLAPVASDLSYGYGLSGFSYSTLEEDNGADISFYNTQFYSGFGSMASTSDFDEMVANGWSPTKIVIGQLTSPSNGFGYVPQATLNNTIISLRQKYGQIGGVMGWEYFNSAPGGTAAPWEWAVIMTSILRPGQTPTLTISQSRAEHLQSTYMESWRASGMMMTSSFVKTQPRTNYLSMVNV
ncbi:Chitinase 2 [Escovopsis weberi]|uniref:Chitinase 2 n=1 Tax=Escovopsis weberi TaxID=150374 RepID=A0A0N0RU10_ESCWE|nr:Chitinase 2 [Escovopsis weberi]